MSVLLNLLASIPDPNLPAAAQSEHDTFLLLVPSVIGMVLGFVAHFSTTVVVERSRDKLASFDESDRELVLDRVAWAADVVGIAPSLAGPIFGVAVAYGTNQPGLAVATYLVAILLAAVVPFAMIASDPSRYLSRRFTRLQFTRGTVAGMGLNGLVLVALAAQHVFA
ncbi:MAG TPA: hypothetical protein PK020_21230 [Ilumatobacteraceae bacterium]|nr:hypothetical protein [Ilumatobacteraceae bacterium]